MRSLGIVFFGIMLAFTADGNTYPKVGYADNLCASSVTSVSFGAFRTMNGMRTPGIRATYYYACDDGRNYTKIVDTAANLFCPLQYGLTGTLPNNLILTYDETNARFKMTGSLPAGMANPYYLPDPLRKPLAFVHAYEGLANPKVPVKNNQKWVSEAQGLAGNKLVLKYKPGELTVTQLFPKLYPAFALVDGKDRKEGTPRPILHISYNGDKGVKAPDGFDPVYKAIVYYFPGQGDSDPFNRPLIVADAFDFMNKRTADKAYSDVEYAALLAQNDETKPLERDKGRLSPRAFGYDVYFVDFGQGAGNLRINAALLLKFIEWMHSKTQNPMIVGGPSQGGITARLALLYSMPANNLANGPDVTGKDLAPRVKGFLSIDSPHQGASITGHAQEAVLDISTDKDVEGHRDWWDWVSDEPNDAKEEWLKLCSPAAYQMLYEHHHELTRTTTQKVHQDFQDSLKSMGAKGGAIGDPRGYRKDMPRVAIAGSNFFVPMEAWNENAYNRAVRITLPTSIFGSEDYFDFGSGGPVGSPMWIDLTPGSAGDWFWNPVTKEKANKYMSIGSSNGETYCGTFIPLVSALDLTGINPMNPETRQEHALAKYSPFDAVFYLHDYYNGYATFLNPAAKSETNNDRRYAHGVFDLQMMDAIMRGLKAVEETYQVRISSLQPYDYGYRQITLTGPSTWLSVPRAYSNYDWSAKKLMPFTVNNIPVSGFAVQSLEHRATFMEGDFNGDARPDGLLTYGWRWGGLPTILSAGPDNLAYKSRTDPIGMDPIAKVGMADFNWDGRDDLILAGKLNVNDLHIGFSNGDGTFTKKATPAPSFTALARTPEAKLATGDFNNDYYADVLLAGGTGWTQIHLGLGDGTGNFTFKSLAAPKFAALAAKKGAIIVAGGFKSSFQRGLAAIADKTVCTFYTTGDYVYETCTGLSFNPALPFWDYALDPLSKIVAADFNADGRTDIAFPGSATNDVPVAFSNGNGGFTFYRNPATTIPIRARTSGARLSVMDIDQDLRADLVFYGGSTWNYVQVGFGRSDGNFIPEQTTAGDFTSWSRSKEVRAPYPMLRAY